MEELIVPDSIEYADDNDKQSNNVIEVIQIKREIEDDANLDREGDEDFIPRKVNFDFIVCGCGKNFKTDELLRKHHEKKCSKTVVSYQCLLCRRVFSSKQGCTMHASKVHGINGNPRKNKPEKTNVCEVCGKSYNSAAALRYHMRVHTGEKPYSCHLCPKAFTMPLFLQLHIRTHTGERPYRCDQCPKAFGNKAAIMRHQRVHTGEKPYECPECNKAFSQSNSMKLHLRTVHWKEPAPYKSKARKNKLKASGKDNADKTEKPKPKPPVLIKIKKTDIFGKLTFATGEDHFQIVQQVPCKEEEPVLEEYVITDTDGQEPCEVTIDNDQYQYFVEEDVQYQVEIKPEYYEES